MSGKAPFAESFRAEVARLARKEVRAQVGPLSKELVQARKTISAQKREIADLRRELRSLAKSVSRKVGTEGSVPELPVKWRKDTVRSTRRKLGLTQGELAAILGVSLGSVNGWETGRTEPRMHWKREVLELRALSPDEVAARS
ncbi:MAG: hypothetical protein CMJ94_12180 [Planctomycetes bacterium]|nr:hypothetical protein [Planctomycetota bacterium]